MSRLRDFASRKQRPILSVLAPLLLLGFCGRAFLATAGGQQSVSARVLPADAAPVAPRPAEGQARAAGLRSLAHPFPRAGSPGEDVATFSGFGFGSPSYPVAAGEKAVWYSAGVNQIRSALLLPQVTWLGTEFGLKRLDNRARTVTALLRSRWAALQPHHGARRAERAGTLLRRGAERTADDPTALSGRNPPHHTDDRALPLPCADAADGRRSPRRRATIRRASMSGRRNSRKRTRNIGCSTAPSAERAVCHGRRRSCLPCPGAGAAGAGARAGLSRAGRGRRQDTLPELSPTQPFHLSFAQADADSLWVGSDLGLLRYDFQARRWDRLLSDLVVTGGCPARAPGASGC